MITDHGIWTIVIILIAITFAVKYSRSKTFRDALFWLAWDFTGARFVWSKVSNQSKEELDKNPPATFVIWVVGIYTALFGIASGRYESSVGKNGIRT